MNMLSKVTPWPWEPDAKDHTLIRDQRGDIRVAIFHKSAPSNAERARDEATRDLLALAPDHALLLAALSTAGVNYKSGPDGRRVVMVDGVGVWDANDDDRFGCPIITPELRAALRAALGLDGATP